MDNEVAEYIKQVQSLAKIILLNRR